MERMMEHKNSKLTTKWENWAASYWAANYWAANLPIGRSSGAAYLVAPCGSCGNREIATPISTPGAQYA